MIIAPFILYIKIELMYGYEQRHHSHLSKGDGNQNVGLGKEERATGKRWEKIKGGWIRSEVICSTNVVRVLV